MTSELLIHVRDELLFFGGGGHFFKLSTQFFPAFSKCRQFFFTNFYHANNSFSLLEPKSFYEVRFLLAELALGIAN